MANNRMYLLHRPSGKAVYLAKRLGWGWYGVSENIAEKLRKLFEMVEDPENAQDDFCIVMEDADNAPMVLDIEECENFDEIGNGNA